MKIDLSPGNSSLKPSRPLGRDARPSLVSSLCGAAVVALLALASPAAAKAPPRVFGDAKIESLTRLRVHYQFDTVYLERSGKPAAWWVKGTGLAASDVMMDGARKLLAALHEGEPVARARTEVDLERYRLDQVEAWGLELGFGSGKSEVILLSFDAEEASLYWKRAARPEVYRVRNAPWTISMYADDWKSRDFFPGFSLFDIRTIDVSWSEGDSRTEHYKLLKVRRDSAVIVAPDTLRIHLKKAAEIFVMTEQFAVDAFYGPGAAPAADTKAPWVSVRFEMEDGSVHAARTVGQDGRHYAVAHPRSGAMVMVERFRFDKFKRSLEYLTAHPQYGPEAMEWAVEEDIKGIGVFAPHRESQLEAEGELDDPHHGHDH